MHSSFRTVTINEFTILIKWNKSQSIKDSLSFTTDPTKIHERGQRPKAGQGRDTLRNESGGKRERVQKTSQTLRRQTL